MSQEKKKKISGSIFSKILILWALFICLLTAFAVGAKVEQQHLVRTALKARVNNKMIRHNSAYSYSIIDGSLYKVFPNERSEMIVTKNSLKYEDMEESTPFKITDFKFSPDNSKLLVHAQGAISLDILFVVECTGGMITPIGPVVSSVWSPDSKHIAFTTRPADIGPLTLKIYDATRKEQAALEEPTNFKLMDFSNITWFENDAIHADYVQYSDIPNGKVTKRGEITIKLLSNSTTLEE